MEVTLILGNLFKMFGIWKIKWWNSRVAYACNLGPREGGAGKINIEANLCYTARTCLRQTSKSKHDRLLPLCRRAGLYLGASIVLLRFRGLGGVSLPAPWRTAAAARGHSPDLATLCGRSGQLAGIRSGLPPCGFRGMNAALPGWSEHLLPLALPSGWPMGWWKSSASLCVGIWMLFLLFK